MFTEHLENLNLVKMIKILIKKKTIYKRSYYIFQNRAQGFRVHLPIDIFNSLDVSLRDHRKKNTLYMQVLATIVTDHCTCALELVGEGNDLVFMENSQ